MEGREENRKWIYIIVNLPTDLAITKVFPLSYINHKGTSSFLNPYEILCLNQGYYESLFVLLLFRFYFT